MHVHSAGRLGAHRHGGGEQGPGLAVWRQRYRLRDSGRRRRHSLALWLSIGERLFALGAGGADLSACRSGAGGQLGNICRLYGPERKSIVDYFHRNSWNLV